SKLSYEVEGAGHEKERFLLESDGASARESFGRSGDGLRTDSGGAPEAPEGVDARRARARHFGEDGRRDPRSEAPQHRRDVLVAIRSEEKDDRCSREVIVE